MKTIGPRDSYWHNLQTSPERATLDVSAHNPRHRTMSAAPRRSAMKPFLGLISGAHPQASSNDYVIPEGIAGMAFEDCSAGALQR